MVKEAETETKPERENRRSINPATAGKALRHILFNVSLNRNSTQPHGFGGLLWRCKITIRACKALRDPYEAPFSLEHVHVALPLAKSQALSS